MEVPSLQAWRFGPYELRLPTHELFKCGIRIKLPPQAFEVLRLLLERRGELVTRQEFHRALWPADTFVDFDQGLNNAVKRIREALNDSAEAPRYVETLPRLGYRFVAAVESRQKDVADPQKGPETAVDADRGPNTAINKIREAGDSAEKPRFVPTLPTRGDPFIYQTEATGEPQAGMRAQTVPISRVSGFKRLRLAAWLVPVILAALGAAFVYLQPSRHAQAEPLTALNFTGFAGSEVAPAFSPDGSQIAFAWGGDPPSGFDLYVKTIGSQKLLRLTHTPSVEISPAWSPDGAEIAFHRILGKEAGIYAVPAQGGPEKKLHQTSVSLHSPAISWSPDGQWIAFADSPLAGGHWRLYLLWLDTLRTTQIPHAQECLDELDPAFSHDGKRLAYACVLEHGGFSVYSLAAPSGSPQFIRHFEGWPSGIAWAGGDRGLILALSKGEANNNHLYEMALPDGSLQKLPFAGSLISPAVSASGDKLAYSATTDDDRDTSIWRKDLLHPDAAPANFISSTRSDVLPQFSPDGKHIAFSSTRRGNPEIWMSNADGSNPIQISHFGNPVTGSPFWSPDSRKIIFDSGEFGAASIYIADIVERVPRKLITNVRFTSVPSWSRDGKWIYFLGNGNENGGIIYRCPAKGGNAVALSAGRGYAPQESFDRKSLYFAANGNGNTVLKVVPLQGDSAESAVDGLPPLRFVTDWTVAPGGVYFIPADAPRSIRYFDFRTRRSHQVLEGRWFSMGISVSGDGRWLLYTQVNEFDLDIMLVENFR